MSLLISLFWIIEIVVWSVRCRSLVVRWEAGLFSSQVLYNGVFAYLTFVVLAALVNCFAEKRSTYLDIERQGPLGSLPPCPEEDANLPSILTFSWMDKTMRTGYKKPLERSDLFALRAGESCHEINNKFEGVWAEELRRPRPRIARALFRAFGDTFLAAAVFKVIQDLLNFVSPPLLNGLITYVTDPSVPTWEGYWYTGLLFSAAVVQSFILHQVSDVLSCETI